MSAYLSVFLRCDGPLGGDGCPSDAYLDTGHEDEDAARRHAHDECGWTEDAGHDLCADCSADTEAV